MAYVCKMAHYLSIKQFSELVDIPINTLRNWDESGKLDMLEDESTGHYKMVVGEFDKGVIDDKIGDKVKEKEFIWCRYDGKHILKLNEQSNSYEWQ